MSEQLRFVPPRVEFDPTLANELARYPASAPTVDGNIFPAAEAALPFVHPKLSVAANVYSFAAQMEELSRLRDKSNVIDAPKRMIETEPEGRTR
jgi:hypothetical protein